MARYTESDIENAKKEVENGVSLRKAAAHYNIPTMTLQTRMKGGANHKTGAERLQVLSPGQEADLAAWIKIQAQIGCAPTHLQICAVAERLLANAGCPRSLGATWKRGFLARHPEIKGLRRTSVRNVRAHGATEANGLVIGRSDRKSEVERGL